MQDVFYVITLLFLLRWGLCVAASCLRVLVRPSTDPPAYLMASVWLTFVRCFLFDAELRDRLRAQLPGCAQVTLLCDLKGHSQAHPNPAFPFSLDTDVIFPLCHL